jgi:hypothetical protein
MPSTQNKPQKGIHKGRKNLSRRQVQPLQRPVRYRHYPYDSYRDAKILLVWVKVLHTIVFLVMFGAILFLLYCGLVNQLSHWTALAFVLISVEVTVYVSHGFKCPLNTLAARLTSADQRVNDIYLPPWLSSRVIAISTPLLAIACCLLLIRLLMGW